MNDIGENLELTPHPYHKTGTSFSEIHSSGYNLLGRTRLKDGPNNSQEWVVDDLDKYSEYEFIVQAYNMIGPGPLSDPITAITLEDGEC